ncbi:MAG: hypothetical protein GY841_19460, partial [FCB group bacterium]|nr:hypothetical protein [FCB group bacterium]
MCNSLGLKSHKRICLFAGYNADNKIAVHVLDYLRELSRYCDVYYLADGELEPNELEKAKSLCNNAWVKDHGKYDFGSYSELARDYVGWETISQYDELILANDSCFCLQEFGPVFAKMDNESTDVWCLMATDELNTDRIFSLEDYQKIPSKKIPMFCAGSYFLAFRRSVVEDKRFRDFLNEVKIGQNRQQICLKYEMGLTANLIKWGYRISGFIKVVYKNAAIYGEQAFRLLKQGFPLLKARIFIDNPMSVANLKDWIDVTVALVGNDRLPHYLNDLSGLEPSVARLCKYRPRPSLVDPSAPEPPL